MLGVLGSWLIAWAVSTTEPILPTFLRNSPTLLTLILLFPWPSAVPGGCLYCLKLLSISTNENLGYKFVNFNSASDSRIWTSFNYYIWFYFTIFKGFNFIDSDVIPKFYYSYVFKIALLFWIFFIWFLINFLFFTFKNWFFLSNPFIVYVFIFWLLFIF